MTTEPRPQFPMPPITRVFAGQPIRITDGDTIHVLLDALVVWAPINVRLARCNAPEMTTPEGREAKRWVTEWLAVAGGAWPLRVELRGKDRYGRYVAEVWRVVDGANLSDSLIQAGQAVIYMALMAETYPDET